MSNSDYPGEIEHGIMFHHFHDKKHPKVQGSISPQNFEDILNFIGISRILNPFEWIKKLEKNELNPEDVCLTFDDSLLCQFEAALPVLDKYNLKAFWFVYSNVFEGQLEKMEIYRIFRSKFFKNIDDFYNLFLKKVSDSEFSKKAEQVITGKDISKFKEQNAFYSTNDVKFRYIRDRALGKSGYEMIMDKIILEQGRNISDLSKDLWMSNEHLRKLTDCGHAVGLHSYSHPMVLNKLSYKEQFKEYERNYLHIKKVCGGNPVSVSHPCNSYNEDTIKILNHFGIRVGFRSNMFPKLKGGEINPNKFEIARQDHANIMRMLDNQR